MNEQEFRQELKKGLSGVYFFFGEEEYLKKFYSGRALVQTVGDDADISSWNSYLLESKKAKNEPADFSSLEEAINAVPIMGDKIFVKYNIDFPVMSDDEIESFLSIIRSVDGENTVVIISAPEYGFNPGKLPKTPSALYKKLDAVCKTVNFCKMTKAELKKWINRRLAKDGLCTDAIGAEELIEKSGTSMYALAGELDKLTAYAFANSAECIDADMVRAVCAHNEEEVAYAMANAIMNGDRRGALKELHRCKSARVDPIKAMGMVSKSLCEMLTVCCLMEEGDDRKAIASKLSMHEYKTGLMMNSVKNISSKQLTATLNRCREADVVLKSSALGYIALERFICTIPTGRSVRR